MFPAGETPNGPQEAEWSSEPLDREGPGTPIILSHQQSDGVKHHLRLLEDALQGLKVSGTDLLAAPTSRAQRTLCKVAATGFACPVSVLTCSISHRPRKYIWKSLILAEGRKQAPNMFSEVLVLQAEAKTHFVAEWEEGHGSTRVYESCSEQFSLHSC